MARIREICLLVLGLAVVGSAQAGGREYAADLHYEHGSHALRLGDADTAVDQLSRAAELAPDDPATLGMYARALLLAGEPAEALAVLQRLREVDPEAPDLDLMLGLSHMRLRQWAEARGHLEKARETHPESARIPLFLGVTYQELGEYELAEAALKDAVAKDPALETRVSYRLAVQAARNEQLHGEARRLFEEVLARTPGSALADSASLHLRNLGGERRRWGGYATIGAAYDSNVTLAGDDIAVSDKSDSRSELEAGLQYLLYEADGLQLKAGWRGTLNAHRHETYLNIASNRGWAQASYEVSERIGTDLYYHLDYAWADGDSYRRTHRVEPALRIGLSENLLTRAFYRYEDRGFFYEAKCFADLGDTSMCAPPGPSPRFPTGPILVDFRGLDRDGDVQT